jgi:hypothetical protein
MPPQLSEQMSDPNSAAIDETALRALAGELLGRISVAYAGVPRPAITHSVARGYDDEWHLSMERGLELTAQDPEQIWTEVTDAAIHNFQEYFSFSDAEGWRFYLPAYMSYYLRDPLHRHYVALDACFWGDPEFGRVTRLDLLTPEQLACFHDFFHFAELVEGHRNEVYFRKEATRRRMPLGRSGSPEDDA